MELKDLREQIDGIDRELVELFKKRMNVSAAVAEYKKQNKTLNQIKIQQTPN